MAAPSAPLRSSASVDDLPTPDSVIRVAGYDDVAFLDDLAKRHRHELGFIPRAGLEIMTSKRRAVCGTERGQNAGYVLGAPGYAGCNRTGIVYHACVEPDLRLVGFGRALLAAWGKQCAPLARRLVLWCAADLPACLFWQAVGLQPVAWRYGSIRRKRVHVLFRGFLNGATASERFGPLPWQTSFGLLQAKRRVYGLAENAQLGDVVRAALHDIGVVNSDGEVAPIPDRFTATYRRKARRR